MSVFDTTFRTLITSGGCKVPIDDVRHIGNFASGRYGIKLAQCMCIHEQDYVQVFREKGSDWLDEYWDDAYNQDEHIFQEEYTDYFDYLRVKQIITDWKPNIIISAAAISDYIVDKVEGKISSSEDELIIRLKKGEKVIKSFRKLAPDATIVAFKLLVDPDECDQNEAIYKAFKAGVDLVVYNNLAELRKGNAARTLYQKYKLIEAFYPTVCETPQELANAIHKYHFEK